MELSIRNAELKDVKAITELSGQLGYYFGTVTLHIDRALEKYYNHR